jgi:hypothetical protein
LALVLPLPGHLVAAREGQQNCYLQGTGWRTAAGTPEAMVVALTVVVAPKVWPKGLRAEPFAPMSDPLHRR